MYQKLKDFIDSLKRKFFKPVEIVKPPDMFLPIPENIYGFTGLEVLTRVNGKIVSRCLHKVNGRGLVQHWYLQPTRLNDQEQLIGYTAKIHTDLY